MGGKLLVIDDDVASCKLVRAVFATEGFDVLVAHDGASGLGRATSFRPDVVILDLRLPGVSGLDILDKICRLDDAPPVVMLTAHLEVKSAVKATQLGAFDYLTKPFDHDELRLVIRRAFETRVLRTELEILRRRLGDAGGLAEQMGPSKAVAAVVEQVKTVAETGFSVLLRGETGTGKEVVAHAIHKASERRSSPFVAVDCGAIPDMLLESELFGHEKGAFTGAQAKKAGRFHLAEGGTLFLDEVGNLPIGLQSKLLRVLESREVQAVGGTRATPLDVRFIAATNDDLRARSAQGEFRSDLYFRLAQYTIALPALRDRTEDIPHLAARFLAEASVELRRPMTEIAPDALTALEGHAWPGNVRELRNAVRQGVLESKGGVLTRAVVQSLLGKAESTAKAQPESRGLRSLREIAEGAAREAERHAISEVLRSTRGNKSQAARELKTDYKTLHVKMKSLGIRAKDFTP